MTFAHPQYLVETDWLEAHLPDPDLRVLDCTVLFQTDAHGVRVNNGREAWAQGHIPGSGFADLMQDLSDRDSRLPFMMPRAAQFAEVKGGYGLGRAPGSYCMTPAATSRRTCGRRASGGCCGPSASSRRRC